MTDTTYAPPIVPPTRVAVVSREGRSRHWGPVLLVAAAVLFNAWFLRAETAHVQTLNDTGMHAQMVRWASGQIENGRVPLDGWYPYLGLGSPHFHHYQSLPHVLTAYAGRIAGTERAFSWSAYLLVVFWPIVVYATARLFGLGWWAAAGAAIVAPLLTSSPGHGYEYGSYVWSGYGVWSQLFGMWMLPFALALTWRAVSRGRGFAPAALFVALAIATHFLTGYLAILCVGLWVLIGPQEFLRRTAHAALVVGGSVLAAAWVVVPLLQDSRWSLRSTFMQHTFFTDSYGARTVLGWLFGGDLFDAGRFPVVTLLVAVGVVVCIVRSRRDEPSRALLSVFALSLLLFFGRPTLGPLLRLLPGSDDLLLHRYIMGVQMAGILLAGVGAAWLGRASLRFVQAVRSRDTDYRPRLVTAGIVLAGLGVLYPAWTERIAYARASAAQLRSQRAADATDGADVVALIAEAKAGGGRIYAGLRANWGRTYTVGSVPVYSVLAWHDADAVGFTLRTVSLSTDVEALFNETSPSHYELMNVRHLLLPADRPPPVAATFVVQRGRHRLWRVETSGYVQVVDAGPAVAADRANLATQMGGFLGSAIRPQGPIPAVAFDGDRSLAETSGAGSPGVVEQEVVALADGFFGARVTAERDAVAWIKATFDPRFAATVDGVPVRTGMMAPSFIGVPVPAGQHYVAVEYRPYGAYPWLFALGAATLGGLAVWDRRARRRPLRPTRVGRPRAVSRARPASRPRTRRGNQSPLTLLVAAGVATVAVVWTFTATTGSTIALNDGCGFDGARYCAMVRGALVDPPYNRRVLIPRFVSALGAESTGEIVARFRAVAYVSLLAAAAVTVALTRRFARRLGSPPARATRFGFVAACLMLVAPMGVHFANFDPVLADLPAMALGLAWFLAFTDRRPAMRWLSLPLAFLTLATREQWLLPIVPVVAVTALLRRDPRRLAFCAASLAVVTVASWIAFTAPSNGASFSYFDALRWLIVRTAFVTPLAPAHLAWMLVFTFGFVPLLLVSWRRRVLDDGRRDIRDDVPLLVPAGLVVLAHGGFALSQGGDFPRILFAAAPIVLALVAAWVARPGGPDRLFAITAAVTLVVWRPLHVLGGAQDNYFQFFTPVFLMGRRTMLDRMLADFALSLIAFVVCTTVALAWTFVVDRRRARRSASAA